MKTGTIRKLLKDVTERECDFCFNNFQSKVALTSPQLKKTESKEQDINIPEETKRDTEENPAGTIKKKVIPQFQHLGK